MAEEVRTTKELFGEVKTTEELFGAKISLDKGMAFVAAPEPTFGQKWKEYFLPDEGRWTKPDRYEKFYNITKYPITTGLKMVGSVVNRMNKFLTEVSPAPEVMETIATLNPNALKDIFPSMLRARKVFYPVPGAADELKTMGEAMAKDWYIPLTGEEPPWWYTPAMDIAFEALLFSAAAAQRASRIRMAPEFGKAKLTAIEIKAAKRIFSTKQIAKMQPAQVRATLAKESAVIVLSKAEKAQLLRRGYKPIQIQRMTPLDAYQLLDDVPIAESAANTNLSSATKVAIDRLAAGIKRAKKLHPKKEKLISQEKARRVAVAEQIRRAKTGEAAAYATRGPLAGEYPVPAFTAPEISSADRFYLFESLRISKMPYFRYRNTSDALIKILRGDMPTRGETVLLQRHFGEGLAKAILQKRTLGTKAWQNVIDVLNIPRATLASYDLSFPLRQGIILLPGHPKRWAISFGQMIKSARPGSKGKEYARHLEDLAENSRYASLRRSAKLDITEWGLTSITTREEPFLSSWAELIPGVKWAERTFTTMSNQLRINVFDDIARNWESAGMSWSTHPEEYLRLAAFLNHATGRGTIPTRYAGITPELNAMFFSPRYQISRPQLVYDAFVSLKNPAARKLIIADEVKFVATGITVLWLLDQIEGVETEPDPRSSDFGKVKYGNTRYDFWAGFSQMARLIAQTASGQQKATGTGRLYNINRADVIERYVRTKLSPPAGLTWDILKGQTFVGEEMKFEPTFLAEDIPKRVIPMVAQDIVDAIRYQGLDGALPITSTTAFFGVGVGTWEPSKWTLLTRAKDELAMATYGKEWDVLNEIEQALLTRDNKLLDNLKREAEYDRTVFPFLEEIKKEQLVAGMDVEGRLPESIQEEMQRLKIRVGSLPRTFGKWTLNDERYEEYKDHITAELQTVLTPILKRPDWGKMPKEAQIRFIEKAIEIAKKRARTRIRIEARK